MEGSESGLFKFEFYPLDPPQRVFVELDVEGFGEQLQGALL